MSGTQQDILYTSMFINFKIRKLTCVNRNKDSRTFGKVVDFDVRAASWGTGHILFLFPDGG